MKFSQIKFKCRYDTYAGKFDVWSPNCCTVKRHRYDRIYRAATDIRRDVIGDLKKEYFLSDDDIEQIEQKIFAALSEICSAVGY